MSRQLLSALAADIGRLPAEAHKEVASFALDRLAPRLVSFEEVCSQLRVSLAAVHESQEAWSAAAAALAGIDLDSGQRSLGATYKLATCVKIARLYLEDDDALAAEGFIKKAAFLLPEAPDEALDLQARLAFYSGCRRRSLEDRRVDGFGGARRPSAL